MIKNVCRKYYGYVNKYNSVTNYTATKGNTKVTDEERNATYNEMYNILDYEYINSNNISDDEIKQIIVKYKDTDDFEINKMYFQDIEENTAIFWADISLLKEHKKVSNKIIVGKLDTKKGLFAIIPVEISSKEIFNNNIKVSTNEIEKNEYNQCEYNIISDQQVVNDILSKFKNTILYDREDAYNNLLDEECKKNKFKDYSTFSKYIDNNLRKISNLNFVEYSINKYNDYKEYICKDKDGNVYTFHEKAVMDFTVILDE